MKKLMNKNICVPMWYQVAVICILTHVLQSDAQGSNINPNDQLELTSNLKMQRQQRALNSLNDEDCPYCNLSEVSWRLFMIHNFI